MGTRGLMLVLALGLLGGCGGGGGGYGGSAGGGGGGGSTPLPSVAPTANDSSVNSARHADLATLRGQCGGTALAVVDSPNALIVSATRHAGWQAIDDASQPGLHLNHGEPRSNTLFSADFFANRIVAANGGSDLPGINSYYEDIASTAGATAITQLWNTVYHRVPMMRHGARSMGYGDMAMARADYPTAGVPAVDEWGNSPAGNGYATMDWAGYASPAVTLSYWPSANTTVPTTFVSDNESPDPVPGRNQVGCPIHVILPETAGDYTVVNITLVTGSTHIPLRVLAGNGSPAGAAGDVATLVADGDLARGELFAIPVPAPTNTGLAAGTYTFNVAVTLNGTAYSISNVTYFTAP